MIIKACHFASDELSRVKCEQPFFYWLYIAKILKMKSLKVNCFMSSAIAKIIQLKEIWRFLLMVQLGTQKY